MPGTLAVIPSLATVHSSQRNSILNFLNRHIWSDVTSHTTIQLRHRQFSINVWTHTVGDPFVFSFTDSMALFIIIFWSILCQTYWIQSCWICGCLRTGHRRIFGPKRNEMIEGQRKCIMRSRITCMLHQT
jgi:hypothetical protein